MDLAAWLSASAQATSAQFSELLAILTRLRYLYYCPDYTVLNIILETDSKSSILLIEGEQQLDSSSDYRSLITKIRFLLSGMPRCKLTYVPREANQAAEWLAQFASFSSSCTYWTNSLPDELQYILVSDSGDTFGVIHSF